MSDQLSDIRDRLRIIQHRDNPNRSRCKRIQELKEVRDHFYSNFDKTGEIDMHDLIEIVLNTLSLQECRQQDYGR